MGTLVWYLAWVMFPVLIVVLATNKKTKAWLKRAKSTMNNLWEKRRGLNKVSIFLLSFVFSVVLGCIGAFAIYLPFGFIDMMTEAISGDSFLKLSDFFEFVPICSLVSFFPVLSLFTKNYKRNLGICFCIIGVIIFGILMVNTIENWFL